jgi:hypothetical protein
VTFNEQSEIFHLNFNRSALIIKPFLNQRAIEKKIKNTKN